MPVSKSISPTDLIPTSSSSTSVNSYSARYPPAKIPVEASTELAEVKETATAASTPKIFGFFIAFFILIIFSILPINFIGCVPIEEYMSVLSSCPCIETRYNTSKYSLIFPRYLLQTFQSQAYSFH